MDLRKCTHTYIYIDNKYKVQGDIITKRNTTRLLIDKNDKNK